MPQKFICRVEKILDHGDHVYSLILRPEHPAPRFHAGQFLHLTLDQYRHGDFWPDSRPFSIASSPVKRDSLQITYAVKGGFTSRMEAELKPGSEVWVKMPYGDFVITDDAEICLLAGGTGITAFTGFISGLGAFQVQPVSLYYGARRPDLLIYRSQVEMVAKNCPVFKPVFMVEQEASPGCLTGQINLDLIWKDLKDPMAVAYYISGPPEMLTSLSYGLKKRGIAPEMIHTDAWE